MSPGHAIVVNDLILYLHVSRLPGHSHQLFHICAVVGTHFQMEAVLADMTSRRGWLTAHSAAPSILGTLGALALAVLLNLSIIALFSVSLLRAPGLGSEKGGAATRTPQTNAAAKDE